MQAAVDVLIWVIELLISFCHNEWIAILIFTLLTKLLLFPLSLWVQKNSIKIVRLQPQLNRIQARYMGNRDAISEEQYKLYRQEKYSPFLDLVPLFVQLALLMLVVEAVKGGTELTAVPLKAGGVTLLVPVAAALSSWLMCYAQNRINVLQAEQNALNRYGTMIFSVALSLYLGFCVAVGVGFYWICGNLLSIVQLFLLNYLLNPKNYIDYEQLEESKEELRQARRYIDAVRKENRQNPHRGREREDYKRFLAVPDKKLVFYSEKNGFYKYYKNIIEEIIRRTNIVVHYITSDPEDEVFSMESDQFKPYYIGSNKLIVLMMKLETDLMVMTTPDLENFQLKRSYVKKDIEYIYVPHDVNSANLSFHKNALDHFDTIFVSGPRNKEELQEREEKFSLPRKRMVEWGSGVIDDMITAYGKRGEQGEKKDVPVILVAPSWQRDNILDSCIEEMLDALKGCEYHIIVRPHPQYVKHCGKRLDMLEARYERDGIEIQRDFSSNSTVYTADILVTDWSSIAFEYAFSTLKPVLFIDTPMKVINPDYEELSTVPIDLELRDKVGIALKEDQVPNVEKAVEQLLGSGRFSEESLRKLRDSYIYNVGESGRAGARYIIDRLVEISEG